MASTALRSLALGCRLLPVRLAAPLGRLLGRLVHVLAPWRLRILRANLGIAGLLSDPTVSLERAVYEHFGEALVLALLPPHRALRLVARAPDGAHAEADFEADCREGGVLVCSAHVGVWELLPAALSPHTSTRSKTHGFLVYRPLHNSCLDRWLLRRRKRAAGIACLSASGSHAALRRALCLGGIVGIVPDQRPADRQTSVTATLFGQPSAFSPGLTVLHRETGAPVWFAAMLVDHSSGSTRLRLHLERLAARAEAEAPLTVGSSAVELMQRYADVLSSLVRRAPAQYLWFHRRWL